MVRQYSGNNKWQQEEGKKYWRRLIINLCVVILCYIAKSWQARIVVVVVDYFACGMLKIFLYEGAIFLHLKQYFIVNSRASMQTFRLKTIKKTFFSSSFVLFAFASYFCFRFEKYLRLGAGNIGTRSNHSLTISLSCRYAKDQAHNTKKPNE